MPNSFADRFAWAGAAVDAPSPYYFTPLAQADVLAHLRTLDRGALASRTRADDYQVIVLHRGTNLAHRDWERMFRKHYRQDPLHPCKICRVLYDLTDSVCSRSFFAFC